MNSSLLLLLLLSITVFALSPLERTDVLGQGASLPADLYRSWSFGFQVYSKFKSEYISTGSGTGITLYAEGKSDYGASDDPNYVLQNPDYIIIPTVATAISVVYNIPEVDIDVNGPLILTPSIVAQIFLNNITMWNDSAIQSINPSHVLPGQPIQPVVRSKKSGTTYSFTSGLSKYDTEFKSIIGDSNLPSWPGTPTNASSNSEIVTICKNNPYTIGFASLPTVTYLFDGHSASLINDAGNAIQPTYQSISEAIKYFDKDNSVGNDLAKFQRRIDANLNRPLNAQGYPINTFTYIILKQTTTDPKRCDRLSHAIQYISWVLTDEVTRNYADSIEFPPISGQTLDLALATLATITCDGIPVVGKYTEYEETITAAAVLAAIFACFCVALTIIYRNHASISHGSPLFVIVFFAAATLLALSSFLFIGDTSDEICSTRVWAVLVIGSMMFAGPIAKLVSLYLFFTPKEKLQLTEFATGRRIDTLALAKAYFSLLIPNIIIAIIWLTITPPVASGVRTCTNTEPFQSFVLLFNFLVLLFSLLYSVKYHSYAINFGEIKALQLMIGSSILISLIQVPALLLKDHIVMFPVQNDQLIFAAPNFIIAIALANSIIYFINRYNAHKSINILLGGLSKKKKKSLKNRFRTLKSHNNPQNTDIENSAMPDGSFDDDVELSSHGKVTRTNISAFIGASSHSGNESSHSDNSSSIYSDTSGSLSNAPIEDLVKNPIDLTYLRHFYATIFSSEILECYVLIEHLKSLNPSSPDWNRCVKTIFDLFIFIGSPWEVNISTARRRLLIQLYRDEEILMNQNSLIELQNSLMELLRGSFITSSTNKRRNSFSSVASPTSFETGSHKLGSAEVKSNASTTT